jgi:hypothetical protein
METNIKSESNYVESEFREVITGNFPDNFDDFEEFTDFANGNGLETFQETIEKGHKNDDFDDFADFTESSVAFETLGNFQENNLNNNFGIQLSDVSFETNLVSLNINILIISSLASSK